VHSRAEHMKRAIITRPIPLYPSERQIRERLGVSERRWASILPVWEREGFPKKDVLTGARFWPAVERFLLNRHGIASQSTIGEAAADGPENWNAIRK
jgi:hypothetical protein